MLATRSRRRFWFAILGALAVIGVFAQNVAGPTKPPSERQIVLRLAWLQAPDGVTIRYQIGHQREITITDGRHEYEGLEFPVPAEIGDEIKLSITPVFEDEFTPTKVRCFIYQIKFGQRIEGHVDPPHGYTTDALESAHCKWVVTP